MHSPGRHLLFLLAVSCLHAQEPAASADLQRQVTEILNHSCAGCHNSKLASGKLRADSLEALGVGGVSGAAVVPGKSSESGLYRRIAATEPSLRMPPTGAALPPGQIAVIKAWIDQGAPGLQSAAPQSRRAVTFEGDVEPVLRSACYPCHSGTKPKSQLRLDARSTALKGGIGGRVILPGDSSASRLVHRIEGRGGEPRMPLGGTPLPADQIAAIRSWIDSGAVWPEAKSGSAEAQIEKHWAYVKPVRPAPPQAGSKMAHPIDAFVAAKLRERGLKFSAPASKEQLIRRVSLDLTGLPPSPRDIDTFSADQSPDAYERLVDRLLASPHFGERWARPWLDYARYADTNGYEADLRRTMWKYRDWVIDALNQDMPFDRFTIEQLAGDLVPNAATAQKIATGFHRNTMYNEEGGVDKDQSYFEVLVDRVNTTTTVWLGSTLGCAQCHNHKYDPFTQKEYYQFMAFFSSAAKKAVPNGDQSTKYEEPKLELPSPAEQKELAKRKARIEALESKLKTPTPQLEADQRKWERGVLRSASDWSTIQPVQLSSTGEASLTVVDDGAILASGPNPREATYVVEGAVSQPRVSAFRLEALPYKDLPRGGPGRDAYGNFLLTGLTVEIWRNGWERVPFKQKLADDGDVEDPEKKQLWVVDVSKEDQRLSRQLILIPASPLVLKGSTRVRISLDQKSPLIGQSIGCFRLSVTGAGDPKPIVSVKPGLRSVVATEQAQRTGKDSLALAAYYRTIAPRLKQDRAALKLLKKESDDSNVPSALVMEETAGIDKPSDFVRTRGAFSAKADPVYAGVPAALGSLPADEAPNRLALARWLVSMDNPLTARVAVNRIWEQYFGRGLVETSEDFGSQGQRPSHPELLDWLAVEFMDKGWKMKAIHRLIVTSETYKQSSVVTPEVLKADPNNRLLARGPRTRLEAEMIRDVALAASGLLDETVGGPSVMPPQPPGIWDLPYNDDKWEESKGSAKYRRALYTFMRRSAPYPALANFDAPSREVCTIRRSRTNTPLQALTTLNDTAFFGAARALGARIVKEGGTNPKERIEYGYRLCTARRPRPADADALLAWQNGEREYFRTHAEEARQLAGDGKDPVEGAVWAMTANVLLNLDEALTKE